MSTAPPPANRDPRHERLRLGQLLLILLVAVIAARMLGRSAQADEGSTFDDAELVALKQNDISYVFIGNSMLGTRIDKEELSTMLGEEVFLLRRGGSASAVWFLQFKNYVVASQLRRKRVVIFFRDRFLTDPLYRTSGKYSKYLAEASHAEEPVLKLVLSGKSRDWRFGIHESIKQQVPLHRFRPKFDRLLDSFGGTSMAACCESGTREENLIAVNSLFKVDKLRRVKEGDTVATSAAKRTFGQALEGSFLPHLIKLAADHNIPLVFVRVQRRPPQEANASLATYIDELATYLEANGTGFIDLSTGETVPLEWYGKGDHIAPEFRKQYTAWFRRRAGAIFEDSK